MNIQFLFFLLKHRYPRVHEIIFYLFTEPLPQILEFDSGKFRFEKGHPVLKRQRSFNKNTVCTPCK